MKPMLVILAVLALATALLPSWGATEDQSDRRLEQEITIDGPALFFSVEKGVRTELWAVHCSQPLRGCVARTSGLALRLDQDQQPWLIAVANPDARISIQMKNYSQDTPALFSQPLSDDTIDRLTSRDSFVLIEENEQVHLRIRTEAIRNVVSYLRWIASDTGRTLRDARLWPDEGRLDPSSMTPDVLERYRVMQRLGGQIQRQLVPGTKPQIEFAIRAQHGSSYYSSTGDAGY